MKTLFMEYVKNKKVAILGFGREGKSTLRLLLEVGGYKSIDILDLNEVNSQSLEGVDAVCGAGYQDNLNDYDIVIKSPGIVLNDDISKYKCEITSQTEIFFEKYKSQIIGITGTKGKSTTTTLVHHILKASNHKTVLAGNIGIPAFDILDEIEDDSIIVFEMSSHMLEYMKVSPRIGVLLNIHEEHLDHYGTMEKYVAAKKNIYTNQNVGDICFVNEDIKAESVSRIVTISTSDLKAGVCVSGKVVHLNKDKEKCLYSIPAEKIKLIGEHNYFDIGVAYGILKYIGISDEDFENGLISYNPLPHRLSFIGSYEGVKYYDDSISTICDTTIQALKSVENVGTVLIGGMDRGINYNELICFLEDFPVENIILMYDTGKRIVAEIKTLPDELNIKFKNRTWLVTDLEQAVALAKKITKPGKSCVLSPAAASYGFFKNFEERGDRFTELVKIAKN